MTTHSENVATPAYGTGSEDAAARRAPAEPTDPLAHLSLARLAELRTLQAERERCERVLKEHLSPVAAGLYNAVSDAHVNEHVAGADVHVAELCRHLPGMAPTIRLLWAHVIDIRLDRIGACCADGGMIDP